MNNQGLVFGGEEERSRREETKRQDGQRRWLATTRWAAAAQFALGMSLTSSQNDLQKLEIIDDANILNKTKDAVITLQNVLQGKHDSEIEDSLNQYQVPADRWWSSLYRVVEGIVSLGFYCSLRS
jgi:ATP-binding cassette, subfamily C (CFTR/MRP), member 1